MLPTSWEMSGTFSLFYSALWGLLGLGEGAKCDPSTKRGGEGVLGV
jgi:hypothetical protein